MPALEGVDVLPLKSWLGWGPPATVVELARWAAWRWAGPESFFLRTASPLTVVRALPRAPQLAPPVRSGDPADPSRLPEALGAVAPSPGAGGADGGPASARDRPARPGARRRRRRRRARAAGRGRSCSCPSAGWAERLTARLVRRGYAATGHGRRPGPAGRWSSATGRVPGRPCPGWPPPWSSTRTTRPTARRVRPPTARWTWSSSGRGGRALRASSRRRCLPSRWRPTRGSDGGTDAPGSNAPAGPPSSGSTVAGPIRARACSPKSSCGWPVPCSTMTPQRHGARWSACTTGPARPASWRAGTAASWPAAPAAARQRHGRGTRKCCAAHAAGTRARSSAPPAVDCA